MDFLNWIFNYSDFTQRNSCGIGWNEDLQFVHMQSDVMIGIGYLILPLMIFYFSLRKKDFPFRHLMFYISTFFIFCGLGHFIDAAMFYYPLYRLSAFNKILQQIVVVATVVKMWTELPRIVNMKYSEDVDYIIKKEKVKIEEEILCELETTQKSLHRMKTAFAIFEPNYELPYKYANRAYLDLFGVDENSLSIIGKSHYEVFPELKKTRNDFYENNCRCVDGISKECNGMDNYRGEYFKWRIFPVFRKGVVICVAFEIWPEEIIKKGDEYE